MTHADVLLLLVLAHGASALLAPALVRMIPRPMLWLGMVPAASFVWLLTTIPAMVRGELIRSKNSWVPELGMDFDFELSPLRWLLAVMVTGVGALVLFYSDAYMERDDPERWRFAAVLSAFAGAMLGLVLADNLVILYVFWEITSVLSYLLIGHNPERRANRQAAMTALLVTTAGGLAMLVGIVMLGTTADSFSVSAIAEAPPQGTTMAVAIILILAGALSKSAIWPFHFWLPGAMAAPTPVSAYLHAAAMVKAGIFLVALLAPWYAGGAGWRLLVLGLGAGTMLLGGIAALRQHDVKLLVAYGTVSQLGFLILAVGAGSTATALAGLTLVLAHALFKSSLFLVVGAVQHRTGVRDLRVLSGLWRRMPWTFAVAVLACASMAGLPPALGFVGKESLLAALLSWSDDVGAPAWQGYLLLGAVVLGSVLTVAYSLRFLWGTFGNTGEPTPVRHGAGGLVWPPAILAVAGTALGFFGAPLTEIFNPYVDTLPGPGPAPVLGLWHGWGIPLLLTGVVLTAGVLLFWTVGRWTSESTEPIRPRANRIYQGILRELDRVAVEVTSVTQRGSLPFYLTLMLIVVITFPGVAALRAISPGTVRIADSGGQFAVAVVVVVGAVAAFRSRRRMRAAMVVGVCGYGTAAIFMLHGAPDLALTQVLSETVMLVVFVLVLRRFGTHFIDRRESRARWRSVGIGAAVGICTAAIAYVSATSRRAEPISQELVGPAKDFGGGLNIVNVTLVDIRAWDTIGEIAVLVVAATGIASLIHLIAGRTRRHRALSFSETPADTPEGTPRWGWIGTHFVLDQERRSVIFEVVTRLLFHPMILFSVYLLLAGHNAPGGGFVAGLLAGLALTVRYLVGGRAELTEAAPLDAGVLMGTGLTVASASAIVPVFFGVEVFQSAAIDIVIPGLAELHIVTSLFFDIGVYLVVIGLVLDILRSLGVGIDEEMGSTPAVGGGRRGR